MDAMDAAPPGAVPCNRGPCVAEKVPLTNRVRRHFARIKAVRGDGSHHGYCRKDERTASAGDQENPNALEPNVAGDRQVVVWDLPPDLLGNLLIQAQEKGVLPENFIIGFLEWKTGRELQSIRLYNREDKQVYIVNKR